MPSTEGLEMPQPAAEHVVQSAREIVVFQALDACGFGGRAAPYDSVQIAAVRVRQNSQGSVSGEALEGPARSGMRCANRGQHGILPVMAFDLPWPAAVRLYCQNARSEERGVGKACGSTCSCLWWLSTS